MQNLIKLQTLEFAETKDNNAQRVIAELRGKIPAQILAHYDRLVARGKKGLAAVRNQVCTGCHMRLPINVVPTLMRGEHIQLCDTCGRYLYLPVETPAAAGKAAPLPAKASPGKGRKRKAVPAAA